MAGKQKTRKPKDTPEQQHARFVEAAKRVGADESPDAMDEAFKKIEPRRVRSRDKRQ
jgi:hypothetical protein